VIGFGLSARHEAPNASSDVTALLAFCREMEESGYLAICVDNAMVDGVSRDLLLGPDPETLTVSTYVRWAHRIEIGSKSTSWSVLPWERHGLLRDWELNRFERRRVNSSIAALARPAILILVRSQSRHHSRTAQ
jgi:hypothetical protein